MRQSCVTDVKKVVPRLRDSWEKSRNLESSFYHHYIAVNIVKHLPDSVRLIDVMFVQGWCKKVVPRLHDHGEISRNLGPAFLL